MTLSVTRTTHGLVLGGGLAGMLTARVLRRHLDQVTVIERDELPEGPQHRKGLPQARHAHLLWSGGARLIESLLPGTTERLQAAGARRIGVYRDMVSLTAYGWQQRFPETQFLFAASRPLLDWTVRDLALADQTITVRSRTEAVALLGDATHVTGVTIRDLDQDTTTDLTADVVVDTTGRGSRLGKWLDALDVPAPQEDVVDSGITYATRVYRAPGRTADAFPMVSVHSDYRTREPGRFGLILPVENGQWIVTLSGTRGSEPPTDDAGFTTFAKELAHPLISELIGLATPLTPVQGSRSTANRRRYFERNTVWPDNLVALGDAVAGFNPVYGHGMSAAARSAAALDRALRRNLGKPELAATALRGISRAVDDPWNLATAQDIFYPNCRIQADDPRLEEELNNQERFTELVCTAGLSAAPVAAAVAGVSALAAPATSLQSPAVLGALRGGTAPAPDAPTLTDEEWARVNASADQD
ncbi:NAD(P)/FAD-dependent oxidoreductase [Streptomyces sp. NBRC 109706]|uniref:NAD(P)/FAD-dependent oxidoreductase n=1 Tax=Streptomyces sp. NBRC 109706 TaxID=1550035 RepID=UPI00099B625A|nr:FAD-dependent monooxygenase [Streptomyces sp. NBRC 109706]